MNINTNFRIHDFKRTLNLSILEYLTILKVKLCGVETFQLVFSLYYYFKNVLIIFSTPADNEILWARFGVNQTTSLDHFFIISYYPFYLLISCFYYFLIICFSSDVDVGHRSKYTSHYRFSLKSDRY